MTRPVPPKTLAEFYEAVRTFCVLTRAREFRIVAQVRYEPAAVPPVAEARSHAEILGLTYRRNSHYDVLYRSKSAATGDPEETP